VAAYDLARNETTGRWGFAEPGPLRDELTALALAGAKTTTASLYLEYEVDGETLAEPGQRDLLVDSSDHPVAIVETVSVRVIRLADVDDRHAIDEGEGYPDAAASRTAHERYWIESGTVDRVRAHLSDPTWAITDDTLVVAERFRIVEELDPEGSRVTTAST
jgi:uncharacterized protein YhfF